MNDIERWLPERWDQIVGNDELKEYFRDLLWAVRKEGHRSGFNLLVTGPSRTGKTATISFGIKCLGCLNLDFQTMDPCGACFNCTNNHHKYGNAGWESYANFLPDGETSTPVHYFFRPIDCTSITEPDLQDVLQTIRRDDSTFRVVYLDEVHRLGRRFMDEKLLKPLEECHAIWIASSAQIMKHDGNANDTLDKMFQNRFTFRIVTQPPTVTTLVGWLAKLCAQWGITCDEPRTTLTLLAERCNQIPGMALHVINKAHKKRSKCLTRSMVETHIFDYDDL